jgi:hypothetical protein
MPDLDTKMQMFLSSFESFQSTGHRQMSQEQYGQTSPDELKNVVRILGIPELWRCNRWYPYTNNRSIRITRGLFK